MNENQRPLWIIIFAILLASIALRTNAQETTEIQFGQKTLLVDRFVDQRSHGPLADSQDSISQDSMLPAPMANPGRPRAAFLSAELAQFDADQDPDGWLARVLLMGADDRPVIVARATARFELMPRLPTHDFTGYVNANIKPIVWTMPLKFDQQGGAIVRLPLDHPITPLAGWPSFSHPAVGQAGGFYSSRRGIIRHTTPAFESRTALTDDQRYGGAQGSIGMASFGQLQLRVSVPGEGVFEAVAPVQLKPSVLVDTRWPYQ